MQQLPSKNHVPAFASWLLEKCLAPDTRDHLIGDLTEEYAQRAAQDPSSATRWFWTQSFRALYHRGADIAGSVAALKVMVVLSTLFLVPVLFSMMAWLSNMDETAPVLWQLLLEGKMHSMLFEASFWLEQPEALSRVDEVHFLIHPWAAVWVAACLGVVAYCQRTRQLSPHQVAAMGYTLMLLPYLFGLAVIAYYQPEPRKIGPILAFMLFNIFYMVVPLSFMLLKQINGHKQLAENRG